MNVKKTIKKIVALGSGLTMIGATIMGATADLGSYPAPFVQDGVFSGKIVVGAGAATSDVLGAIDISASLQAAAKTGVSVAGTEATATVEGGVMLEDGSSQDFNYGDYLSQSTLDNQDFPALLADGVLEDDDGQDYDFEQEITVGNYTLAYSLVDNDVYSEPVLYLDLDAGTNNNWTMTFDLDFDAGDDANVLNLDDSESITMFGSVWTFDDISTVSDDVVLFGSDVTQLVVLNSPVDVEVDGTTYTLNLVGANSDDSTVHVSVNGVVKSMAEGDTKTIEGLKVYVQDVFISTVGGETASASLFIGSRELNLGTAYGSWQDVELDDEELEGVEVYLTGLENATSRIRFRIDPRQLENADTGEDYDWLALGDTFADPLFGFELKFVEAVPALTADSRDYVRFKSSNEDLEFTFTNHDGTEYTVSPYRWLTGVNITDGEDFDLDAQNSIAKDTIFILEEDSSSSEPVSRVFEFRGSDLSDDEASFKDLGSDQTLTVGSGDTLGDTGVTITIDADDIVNLSAASENYVYTASGAKITFQLDTTANVTQEIVVEEDEKAVNSDEVAGDDYTITVGYDSTDDEITIARPGSWDGGADDDDDGDYYYGVGEYGTHYKQEADESTELELWFPMEDVDYSVFLSGSGAAVSAAGVADATYYNVNPIGVGIGVLDTDAPALGSTPMIVVGGPCANTVAAELMGNPANCAEGFEEGKAVIRWYEDSSAILVAGFSALDTQGASRVLADYADWGLSGSEVEVVVPSLSSISVNPVA